MSDNTPQKLDLLEFLENIYLEKFPVKRRTGRTMSVCAITAITEDVLPKNPSYNYKCPFSPKCLYCSGKWKKINRK